MINVQSEQRIRNRIDHTLNMDQSRKHVREVAAHFNALPDSTLKTAQVWAIRERAGEARSNQVISIY